MTIYFTADLHLHHTNIIRYAHRNPPFRNIDAMDNGLIANWNRVISNSDTIYHLGDFCYGDSSAYGKAMHRVHGKTAFIRGNHDSGLQHASYYICRWIDGIKIFMRHWPPWERSFKFMHSFDIPFDVDIILCGHVHDKWKFHTHKLGERRIPVINVGVDVWEFKPVSLNSIRNVAGI